MAGSLSDYLFSQQQKNTAATTDQAKQDAEYITSNGISVSGSPQELSSAREGLDFSKNLYGEGLGAVGQDANQYSQMVKDRLNTDYAKADVYRANANRRVAQGNNKAGLAGVDATGAQEQLYRQSSMDASAMNQDYKDKALALYGRNISARQQGESGIYTAFRGIGNAKTPGPVANYSSGLSIICTELYRQKKISKNTYARATYYGMHLDENTFKGYLIIAAPIVELMKKSDKFSNLFIGWAKSIAKQKPNLLTRLIMPICFMVGYAKRTRKEKAIAIS